MQIDTETLIRIRKSIPLAREELARRVHMDTSSLWKIENGKTLEPRPSTIRKLAEALGVPVSEIAKPDEAA